MKNPEIYKLVENTFYNNWQYLLYESLVRASAIKYLAWEREHKADIEGEIIKQEKAGLVWMRGLVQQMDIYERNRRKYKNFDLFMPQINIFFKKIPGEIANGTITLPKK